MHANAQTAVPAAATDDHVRAGLVGHTASTARMLGIAVDDTVPDDHVLTMVEGSPAWLSGAQHDLLWSA